MFRLRKFLDGLWLTAILCTAGFLQAQVNPLKEFHAACLNHAAPAGNVLVQVELLPPLQRIDPSSGSVYASADITVTFRAAENMAIRHERVHRERVTLTPDTQKNPFLLFWYVTIPSGIYLCDIELHDLPSGRKFFRRIPFSAQNPDVLPGLSDVFMLEKFEGEGMNPAPLLGYDILPVRDFITFHTEVRAKKGENIALRAVLFRKEQTTAGEKINFDFTRASTFSSVTQQNSVIRGTGENVSFDVDIPVKNLEEGEYLFEVSLYAGEKRVAESSRSFVVHWKRLGEIFAQLDSSAIRMKHTASPQWIAALLAEQDPLKKEELFLQFWKARAGSGGDESNALQRYFGRVFYADEHFSDAMPGWESDRGMIYCKFGPPDEITRKEADNQITEQWFFRRWNLLFTFSFQENTFRLLKP